MNMFTAREYAPPMPRGKTSPTRADLAQWRKEAAVWLTAQMAQKFRQSQYAEFANFNAFLFEEQVNEVIAEATHNVWIELED